MKAIETHPLNFGEMSCVLLPTMDAGPSTAVTLGGLFCVV